MVQLLPLTLTPNLQAMKVVYGVMISRQAWYEHRDGLVAGTTCHDGQNLSSPSHLHCHKPLPKPRGSPLTVATVLLDQGPSSWQETRQWPAKENLRLLG